MSLKYVCLTVDGKLNCFDLEIKEDTGILGQRDSGKEEIINATFGLIKAKGNIYLDNVNLLENKSKIYWEKISVVFYDPMRLFNPIYDVASHFIEIGLSHGMENEELILETAKDVLRILGVDKEVLYEYPHKLRPLDLKRVAIGLASFLEPLYVFIDDIEYNLNEIERGIILNNLIDLKETLDITLVVFDNDPAVISRLTNYVVVLYRGEIVEQGYDVIRFPYHPYTIDLVRGELSDKNLVGNGCIYSLNCKFSSYKCITSKPKMVSLGSRLVKCLGYPW